MTIKDAAINISENIKENNKFIDIKKQSEVVEKLNFSLTDDQITTPRSDRIAFRIVERGTDEHCIDQGFKRMALEAGVKIHYNTKAKPSDCVIIAAGPKDTSAIAFGEVFKTSFPNHVSFQLNDKLAPGAYSYLIVIDGVGLICTCLWRKQKNTSRYLNETIACYEKLYPELDREPIKRVGGLSLIHI